LDGPDGPDDLTVVENQYFQFGLVLTRHSLAHANIYVISVRGVDLVEKRNAEEKQVNNSEVSSTVL
jgi:hypothetical protein